MKRKHLNMFIALAMVLALMVSSSPVAFAATPSAEASPVATASGSSTFVNLLRERVTSTQTYNMTVGHACDGKIMFIGFYVDTVSSPGGSTGTAVVDIAEIHGRYHNSFTFSMDGKTVVKEIGRLPAGTYNVWIYPNNHSAQCVYGGSIYSMNY